MTEWIMPCNGQNYNVDAALREMITIEWYQSKPLTNVEIGDVIYIYKSTPVMSLAWRCRVNDTRRMVSKINDSKYFIPPVPDDYEFHGPFLEIQAETELLFGDLLSYQALKAHGLKSRIQGPLRITSALSNYIHSVENMTADEIANDADGLSLKDLERLAERYSDVPVKRASGVSVKYSRNPYIAAFAKRRANGRCQLCNNPAPFVDANGSPYLESHHIVWLSNGGADSVTNIVALCPNCHRKMHIVNDVADVMALKKAVNAFTPQ